MAFKMKGHTLPGPNQKAAPAKLLGIVGLTAAMIAKAAIGSAVGAGVSKGIGAISKAKSNKKADIKESQAEANQASAKSTEDIGDVGSKTKLV